jgi:hypothetical protein
MNIFGFLCDFFPEKNFWGGEISMVIFTLLSKKKKWFFISNLYCRFEPFLNSFQKKFHENTKITPLT